VTARPSPEAIEAAGQSLALAFRIMYGLEGHTVEEAAQMAWTPTGPPLEELVTRIRGHREQAMKAAS